MALIRLFSWLTFFCYFFIYKVDYTYDIKNHFSDVIFHLSAILSPFRDWNNILSYCADIQSDTCDIQSHLSDTPRFRSDIKSSKWHFKII